MNIVYEMSGQYYYDYSGQNLKAALPEKKRKKYKGCTAMNIANEILAQLRKE